jgi:hypothetical protein
MKPTTAKRERVRRIQLRRAVGSGCDVLASSGGTQPLALAQNDCSTSEGRRSKSMPWLTPLSAPISGSTTVARPIGSCSTGVAVRPVPATESCGDSTTITEIGVAMLFCSTTVCPSTSVTETSIGTKKMTPLVPSIASVPPPSVATSTAWPKRFPAAMAASVTMCDWTAFWSSSSPARAGRACLGEAGRTLHRSVRRR